MAPASNLTLLFSSLPHLILYNLGMHLLHTHAGWLAHISKAVLINFLQLSFKQTFNLSDKLGPKNAPQLPFGSDGVKLEPTGVEAVQ